MKTKLKYGIASYSGTIDEITFGSYKKGAVCIARKYVTPRYTDNNETMGKIAKNLSEIYNATSTEFREDMRTYAYLYGSQKAPRTKLNPNGYSLFIRMMYAFAKAYPNSIGLDTITLGDLQSLFDEITSVASAVANGYLPKVKGYELLDASM